MPRSPRPPGLPSSVVRADDLLPLRGRDLLTPMQMAKVAVLRGVRALRKSELQRARLAEFDRRLAERERRSR